VILENNKEQNFKYLVSFKKNNIIILKASKKYIKENIFLFKK